MSLRAIFFMVGYIGFVLAALVFAPAGPWGYLFEWYNHPLYFWWGDEVPDFVGGRWNFVIGIAMILGVLIHQGKFKHVEVMKHPQSKLIVLYFLNAYLVSLWAYSGDKSLEMALDHFKSFLVFYCVAKTQSNPRHLDILLLIGILGCVSWGWEVNTGTYSSREIDIGAPGTYGVNTASAHIVAMVPLIAWFALVRTGWIRWVCVLGMPLLINFVAIGRSRGAMIGLIAVGVITLMITNGKMRRWAFLGALLGAALTIFLMDSQFVERMLGLSDYESDGSASGRIKAWTAAWQVFKENPFGVGDSGFDMGLGAARMEGMFHSTHNMFFETLVAWGLQGAILLYGFIIITVRDCLHIYNTCWDRKFWPPPYEAVVAVGVLTGIGSMLVSSIFLNRYRWEYWWIFAGVVVVLRNYVDSRAHSESDQHMVVGNYATAKGDKKPVRYNKSDRTTGD